MRPIQIIALCAFALLADIALAQLAGDMKLEDAGFRMRVTRTDDARKQAAAIPPHRFVTRVKNGKRYYLYADPKDCQCVFLGDEAAMQAFRDMRKRVPQPDKVPAAGTNSENFVVEQMSSDSDAMIGEGHVLDWTD
jgi:hypothetical protein